MKFKQNAMAALYERQPGESVEAYHAFTVYRGIGRRRTLLEVTRQLSAEKQERQGAARVIFLGANDRAEAAPKQHHKNGSVGKWSSQWEWVKRAAAWDSLVDQRIREKQLDKIAKMAERQAMHAEAAQMFLMTPIEAFLRAMRDPVRAVTIATAPLNELLEYGIQAIGKLPKIQEAERYARGVRVFDDDDATPQGGTAEWRIKVHQPPREEGDSEVIDIAASEPAEWPGDRGGPRDED